MRVDRDESAACGVADRRSLVRDAASGGYFATIASLTLNRSNQRYNLHHFPTLAFTDDD